jgi:hypothetical protein
MRKVILFLSFFIVLNLFGASNLAMNKKSTGDVVIKRDHVIKKVKVGDVLKEGDILMTKSNSSVGFVFHDGTVMSLGENSVLTINKYLFEPVKERFSFDVKLNKGLASFESGKIGKLSPKSVKFRVPDGIIGIRGTKFYVEVK